MRRPEMKDGKVANGEFETIPSVKDPWKDRIYWHQQRHAMAPSRSSSLSW
jgi:hypothetical protein